MVQAELSACAEAWSPGRTSRGPDRPPGPGLPQSLAVSARGPWVPGPIAQRGPSKDRGKESGRGRALQAHVLPPHS